MKTTLLTDKPIKRSEENYPEIYQKTAEVERLRSANPYITMKPSLARKCKNKKKGIDE